MKSFAVCVRLEDKLQADYTLRSVSEDAANESVVECMKQNIWIIQGTNGSVIINTNRIISISITEIQ